MEYWLQPLTIQLKPSNPKFLLNGDMEVSVQNGAGGCPKSSMVGVPPLQEQVIFSAIHIIF